MRAGFVGRAIERVSGWRGVTRRSWMVLAAAALGLLLSVSAFAVLIDDVVEHNGLTRQDLGFGKDT